MTTPAQNDVLLDRWINAERAAQQAAAIVAAETHASANLPIPAAKEGDVALANQTRQAANFARMDFLKLNGVVHPFGPEYVLARSSEFQRLIAVAGGKGAPSAILVELDKAMHMALTREAGGVLPAGMTSPTGKPLPTGTTAPAPGPGTAPAAASKALSYAVVALPALLYYLLKVQR